MAKEICPFMFKFLNIEILYILLNLTSGDLRTLQVYHSCVQNMRSHALGLNWWPCLKAVPPFPTSTLIPFENIYLKDSLSFLCSYYSFGNFNRFPFPSSKNTHFSFSISTLEKPQYFEKDFQLYIFSISLISLTSLLS